MLLSLPDVLHIWCCLDTSDFSKCSFGTAHCSCPQSAFHLGGIDSGRSAVSSATPHYFSRGGTRFSGASLSQVPPCLRIVRFVKERRLRQATRSLLGLNRLRMSVGPTSNEPRPRREEVAYSYLIEQRPIRPILARDARAVIPSLVLSFSSRPTIAIATATATAID